MCVAEEVFGEGDHIGVLVRDRFPGYDNSFKGKQQYCFEHLCLSDNGKILKANCGFGLDDSKSSDALLLRCSDAEVGQDRASGVD